MVGAVVDPEVSSSFQLGNRVELVLAQVNPYRAGQIFSFLRYVPKCTKVLLANFIHTLPYATIPTVLIYRCVHCLL